jgi:hypothetical protein
MITNDTHNATILEYFPVLNAGNTAHGQLL